MDISIKIRRFNATHNGATPEGVLGTSEIEITDLDPANLEQAISVASVILREHAAPAAGTVVSLEHVSGEEFEVRVNGDEVGTFNHDTHGWSGMEAAAAFAHRVADATGAIFEDNR